MIYTERLSK